MIFHFSMKFMSANRIALRRYISGYSVCLCPIKRTPGLYGLRHTCKLDALEHHRVKLIITWYTIFFLAFVLNIDCEY